MPCEVPAVSRMTCPSGACFATYSEPMVPPAPPRFSTTTGCPSASESFCATGRPTTSRAPPGGNEMIIRTGRVGTVTGHEGPYIQLRGIGGGREWDVEPDGVREATSAERLSAATAHVNARSRGEVP